MTKIQTLMQRLIDEDFSDQSLDELFIYLRAHDEVGDRLRELLKVASKSLLEGNLDESAKGHRLGVIEVCEAVLLAF